MAKILIGCETSGEVRRAFSARGHEAWSCDLLPADDGSNMHLVGDIREFLGMGWDFLAVFHPPCTRLCNSGVRWLHQPPPGRTKAEMWAELDEGADLFSKVWNADIPRVCVENPVMHKYAKARIENFQPAAQTVQPWWFGDAAFKATGLYLRGLPELTPTMKLTPPKPGTATHKAWSFIHLAKRGPDRWKLRSKTFPGVAKAMASQWGPLLPGDEPPVQQHLFAA
jgi:hypothetical protein